jgi:hypothetical protein
MRQGEHTLIEAEKSPRSPLLSAVIVTICVALTVVGLLATLVCLVFIHLELIGFGLPLDAEPRGDVIALLVIGAAAGILIPAAACFFLWRTGRRIVVIVAALATLLIGILLFGFGVFS